MAESELNIKAVEDLLNALTEESTIEEMQEAFNAYHELRDDAKTKISEG